LENPSADVDSYVALTITGNGAGHDIALKIADCHKSVTLDFSTGEYWDRSPAQAFRKLERLEESLARIRTALESQV
jgi:hypothetical protein